MFVFCELFVCVRSLLVLRVFCTDRVCRPVGNSPEMFDSFVRLSVFVFVFVFFFLFFVFVFSCLQLVVLNFGVVVLSAVWIRS
mmetsp:Transcript_42063/g.106141  ORF Transcript_42063/g.106141 Transcript_42063/m.106141 type:complete len:83 (-) Transcript_42063:1371-1619(-)